jgi:Na+-translocating ferredoxin:NAD+ oxidoreductase RnfD subunit
MINLRSWWADNRGKVIVLLGIIWIVSVVVHPTQNSVLRPSFAIFLMIICDIGFGFVRRKALFFSLSSLVTGLLIGLILDPSGSIFTLVLACMVASGSKQFFQADNRHIFNPASLGVVIASLITKESVAWWAVSWGIVPAGIIAVWMIPLLWNMRRLWMPLTFLAVYFFSNVYFQNIDAAVRLTLDGTIFLFAFVMVPEPMTAVNRGIWKYIWGALVGLLVLAETISGLSWNDPLILALLGANLIGFILTKIIPSIRTSSR